MMRNFSRARRHHFPFAFSPALTRQGSAIRLVCDLLLGSGSGSQARLGRAREPIASRFFLFALCRTRQFAGCGSPAAGFEVRPIPSAGKIERPTAVRTFFERPAGCCS
jgi:hypothetical protein